MGVVNLAHFMHKITLFHQQQEGLKPEQGAAPLTLTTGWVSLSLPILSLSSIPSPSLPFQGSIPKSS